MFGIENGGMWNDGSPDGMSPTTFKSICSEWWSTYDISAVKITTMALRAVPISQTDLLSALRHFDFVSIWFACISVVVSKRIKSNTIKHKTPINVSIHRIVLMFWKIDDHVCINVDPVAAIPKIFLTCDVKMIRAQALVKPEFTGPETKFKKNPIPIKPMITSTIPVRKQRRTAFCQTPPVACKVSNDEIDDGPIGTSLHEPNNM